VSPSNNTYFDVLRIVQHLINPHVAAALLSKQLGLKPRRLVRDFVDVPLEAGFKSFTDVMKKFYDEMSDQKPCLNIHGFYSLTSQIMQLFMKHITLTILKICKLAK